MKAKTILFVTALLIFNAAAVAQTKKQKVKKTSHLNNTSSQNNKPKAASGNTKFLDSSLLIKSPKTKGKQGR